MLQVGHFARHCKAKQNAYKRNELLKMVDTSYTSSNNHCCVASGATAHMCCERQLFTSFQEHNVFISLAGDKQIVATGTGDVSICINGVQITIQDVLFFPE